MSFGVVYVGFLAHQLIIKKLCHSLTGPSPLSPPRLCGTGERDSKQGELGLRGVLVHHGGPSGTLGMWAHDMQCLC